MFRHQGPSRSERQNIALAAYLACIGGFVNSVGFVLVGSFTSHVTGNVGRFANDLVTHDLAAAGAAFTMIIAFFGGACVASLIVESRRFTRTPTAYGVALVCEAALLASFGLATSAELDASPRLRDGQAILLCVAMGIQNSLVSRLSGAVVRTTHLTGVVTDLGIETARWLAHWRRRLHASKHRRDPPVVAKIRLHLTILIMFIAGAIAGCTLALLWNAAVVWLPTVAVGAGAIYAFANAKHAPVRESIPPHPHIRPPAGSPIE
jgi:uncharacterized membrane protein YoaK (UPF0700 family)